MAANPAPVPSLLSKGEAHGAGSASDKHVDCGRSKVNWGNGMRSLARAAGERGRVCAKALGTRGALGWMKMLGLIGMGGCVGVDGGGGVYACAGVEVGVSVRVGECVCRGAWTGVSARCIGERACVSIKASCLFDCVCAAKS